MIGDHFGDKWKDYKPQQPQVTPYLPQSAFIPPQVSRDEFENLKREVEEMKSLLKRAKLYDEDNGEPDCEMEDKVAFLRKVAEFVGVDLGDVFGKGE